MEHAIAIVLSIVIMIGIVGIVAVYLFNLTINITDEYEVKSDVQLFERDGISIIKVIYTNSGGTDIIEVSMDVNGCDCGSPYKPMDEPNSKPTVPHTTYTFNEKYFGKDLKGKAVTLTYTFDDNAMEEERTKVSHIYQLR